MKRDCIFGYYWVVAHIKHIDIQYNDKPNWREVVTSPTVTVIQKREKFPRSVYIRDSRVDLIHNTTHPTGGPCPRCGESWPRCPPSSPLRARCSRAASTGASRRRRSCGSPGSPEDKCDIRLINMVRLVRLIRLIGVGTTDKVDSDSKFNEDGI